MNITGTCHFPSLQHAYKYYATYGYTKADVNTKIEVGEISTGLPPCKLNEQVILIDNSLRYAVVSEA